MSEPQLDRRARHLPWRPCAALRPYVPSMVGYDFVLDRPGTHRGLPSTRLTLVLPVAESLEVGWHGDGGARAGYWACVSGLHTQPAEVWHPGRMAGVQLGLTPAAARRLFGLPASALSGVLIELNEVVPALAHLPERLGEATTWPERLRVVESAMLQLLTRGPVPAPRPEIGWAMRQLTGPARVAAVADELGLSRRRFGDLFRAEMGLTPKQYQRVARFERSHRELTRQLRSRRPSLAAVAATCGYADQAHLCREWAGLAGAAPSDWLRAEFPFLQDTTTEPLLRSDGPRGPSAEEDGI